MHRVCCVRSSSPAGRIIGTGGVRVRQEPSSSVPLAVAGADLVRNCPASTFGKSKRDVVSPSPARRRRRRRGLKVVTITMPDRKSEGKLGFRAMSQSERRGRAVQAEQDSNRRPVLLVDVMGTIVRDPFHVDMPAFFGLTFKELLASKHPTAWIEFEKGLLSEDEFAVKMFNDRRDYDYEGLKQCMANGYEYLDGMEALLQRLKESGVDMHVFSNYPSWYSMIEEKLNVSQYLPWTVVSCHTGLRKPSQEAFQDAAERLGVQPSECIFIDDQPRNVEAAFSAGMRGIQFQNSQLLEKELAAYGISTEPPLVRAEKAV